MNPQMRSIPMIQPTQERKKSFSSFTYKEATITEPERQELLALSDRLEPQDAERAAALFQLAQLRNVNFTDVLQEFLPSPKSIWCRLGYSHPIALQDS
jgi:hypothetical protein